MESLWNHFGFTLGSLWVHFGVALGSLCRHFGVKFGSLCGEFGITLGSLWSHFSFIGIILESFWNHSDTILALRFFPQPEMESSPYYFILDWRLEIVIATQIFNKIGDPTPRPFRFARATDPHPMITRRCPWALLPDYLVRAKTGW